MEFTTRISKATDTDTIIRGKKLSELMNGSFSDAIFLLLRGQEPNENESRIFEAMLTSIIDHGMGTASAMASRFVSSTGNPTNASVAAGMLALGKYHGGAIEEAMHELVDTARHDAVSVVKNKLAAGERLLGFGHKMYTEDPRAQQLIALTEELNYSSKYLLHALQLEAELEKQKGKKLCLNIDGCMAALLLDMGFPPETGNGVFLIGRCSGLVAHSIEERSEKPVRRIAEKDVQYLGNTSE